MYTTIITSIFFCLVLLEEIVILAVDGIMKDAKLKHFILFKRIIRSLILIEFTLFNFLFSFARPEYVFQLVFQIAGNAVALIYFFLDYFYFSQRTKAYILWMQGIVFNRTPLSKVFEVFDANGIKFKEYKKISQQEFSLVEAGREKGTCILIPSKEGGLLLKPIRKMDDDTLMFYAQKLEIDFDKKGSLKFYKGNLPSEAIKEYDYGTESKIYIWIRDKMFSSKGKTIITFILLGLFMTLIIAFLITDQVFHYDLINDWFMGKL